MPAGDAPGPKLSQFIRAESTLTEFPKEDRAAVLKTLMANLVEIGLISKSNGSAALKLVAEREQLGSTAIGGGIALPHARVKFCDTPVMAFGLLKNGTDFKPLDGAPVRFVFLVLTPKDEDHQHVALLRAITKFAKDPIHLKALGSCRTAEEVAAVFKDYA